jgi:anti-anti-sigma regulatory factor
VGIFSLFGKKDGQEDTSADKESAREKRNASTSRADSARMSGRSRTVKRDLHAARATALKIDAIESEMSSEFVRPTTIQSANTLTGPTTVVGAPPVEKQRAGEKKAKAPTSDAMGTTTQFLLGDATLGGDMAVPASESAAVIEEAAILFANGQNAMAEQVLQAAISEDKLGGATLNAWWMLFDLYQITGKQQEFESLSIEYASKFETSPPAWASTDRPEPGSTPAKPSGTTPSVPFSGKLDATSIKQLDRVKKLAEKHRTLRLEFVRITEVNPIGCGLLLRVLKKLQESGHDLILVGAPELANKIRSILEVGRRDETEVPWLLLLEILRLLNLEKDFEEVSIDYCITFEVSPPAFVTPQNKVTTAVAEQPQPVTAADAFRMPATIEGRIDELIVSIAAYSDKHDPAVIDCSRLTRVDFNAAGRLLTGLAPFCSSGKTIEFHDVNHLVAALFNVMGLKDIARIQPRKN